MTFAEEFDVIFVGSGIAGVSAALSAREMGMKRSPERVSAQSRR